MRLSRSAVRAGRKIATSGVGWPALQRCIDVVYLFIGKHYEPADGNCRHYRDGDGHQPVPYSTAVKAPASVVSSNE